MQPQHGNTLAFRLNSVWYDVHSVVRVEFYTEYDEDLTSIEAVWCDELYKDQIAREKEDGFESNFVHMFEREDEG